jgi:hypothetical protein
MISSSRRAKNLKITKDCIKLLEEIGFRRAYNCTEKIHCHFHEGVIWEVHDEFLQNHVSQGWSKEDVEELRKK